MDTMWWGVNSPCDITVLHFPYRPKHCIEGTRVRFESDEINSDMFLHLILNLVFNYL